jgi:N-acetylglucosaminyl-diphospho-decaprenol L-rhamnosyltransferase
MDAVIVTFNSSGDLGRLLASELTISSFDRIVVVDNASTDDTAEVAERAGVELVRLDQNLGLAAAINLGFRRTSGQGFALLNPDVRVSAAGDVERLARHLADERVGAVAPALVLPDDSLQDSARWTPTPFDLVARRITGEDRGAVRATEPVDVDWAVAAFLILQRSAFERIGGFDESYFLYFEDVELGHQLRAAGYTIVYDPTVRVRHDHAAASRGSLLAPATRHHMRSATRFYLRHPRSMLPRRRRHAGTSRSGAG